MSARLTTLHRTTVFLSTVPHLADRAPINAVRDCLRGVPAVCVGGGPSVDRQIDAIRAMQGRALIVAVNTSAPALVKAGITPDVVVVCEAKDVLDTMPDISGSVLVPGLHIHERLWDVPCAAVAPAITAEGGFGVWLCNTLGVEQIPIGGSSGTLSAGVARTLGCDPIILVGHDCCADQSTGMLYSSGAQWAGTRITYDDGMALVERSQAKLDADETVSPGRERVVRETTAVVKAWDGDGTVVCHGAYDTLRQWWEEAAVQPAWRDRTLINASVGGARLYGWESIRLDDMALCEQVDVRGRLIEALASAAKTDRGTLRAAVEAEAEGARRASELAKEGADLARRLREVQEAMKENIAATDLLESYTWGQFEADRLRGDKEPIFSRMGILLGDIQSGADALDGLLSTVLDSLA